MRLCPVDCTLCADPECRIEGCKRWGEIMLQVCEECGDVYRPIHCGVVCLSCSRGEA